MMYVVWRDPRRSMPYEKLPQSARQDCKASRELRIPARRSLVAALEEATEHSTMHWLAEAMIDDDQYLIWLNIFCCAALSCAA